MGHKFAEIAFTPAVKAAQEASGSRENYASFEHGATHNDRLGPAEAAFITARDSFYMATVGETGWPYVQHRGGPPGFIHVLDGKTIGLADFRGNRQYVSVGNLSADNRVSLILVDYPNRQRLKILGRARIAGFELEPETLELLELPSYRARVERGMMIHIEAYDWNCPQHITPRYTLDQFETLAAPLKSRIAELEAQARELAERSATSKPE